MLPNELCAAGDTGSDYEILKSLRFRGSNLANLSRTFGTPTNANIWTWSAWVKRGSLGSRETLFNGGSSNCNYICFNDNGTEYFGLTYANSGIAVNVMSNALYRDISSHYHLMVVYDSTQAIASERVRLYVNGVRLTSLSVATYPSQNTACYINTAAQSAYIGARGLLDSVSYLEGYMSEVNFIDGQALTPSYFGKWSQDTGQWQAIKYSGTYGSNGFYLDFKDNSGITALGYDKSGNSNHWTPNNFSLTAGSNYDSMDDTPTNNFATLNILNKGSSLTIASGNLKCSASGIISNQISSSILLTQLTYFEINISISTNGNVLVGVCTPSANPNTETGKDANSWGIFIRDNQYQIAINGTLTNVSASNFTAIGIYGCAIDPITGKIWITNNLGQWIGNPVAGTGAIISNIIVTSGLLVSIGHGSTGSQSTAFDINFGQRPFTYTPPEGFNKLCTKNLPTPSIKRGEVGFDIATWTGNGGNIQIGESQFPKFNYQIAKSLRFKGTNSYLNRTPAVAGNRTTWTFSAWVKRGSLGTKQLIFSADYPNSVTQADGITWIGFNANNQIELVHYQDSIGDQYFKTSVLSFIDTSSWVHIVGIFDTSNATVADRLRIYVNNNRITTFARTSDPALNYNGHVNRDRIHILGGGTALNNSYVENYINGYLSEVNFIDGQALDPTNFGEFDINGYWIPKAYTGTYGQNGFYLDFSDTTAVANLGYDKSGRNNNWTPNNISLTAGMTYDSMDDSPTNNFAVLDALTNTTIAISEGSLKIAGSASANTSAQVKSNMTMSNSKWYWEVTLSGSNTSGVIGIVDASVILNNSLSATNLNSLTRCFYMANGLKRTIAGDSTYGATYTTNDVIGIALDLINGVVEFYKNGVSQGIALSGLTGSFVAFSYDTSTGSYSLNLVYNFGQRPFAYTPPTGFKTLSMPNIAEYTYDLESPDLVWIKCRNAAQNHMLFDSVRGAGKYLSSNLVANETTDVNSLVSFNKNGFYLGNNANVNTLNNTYVAWMWKASQQQVTNNNGTIASQVKANPSLGFSVVKYTGNATASQTIGHGLGVSPKMVIVKKLLDGVSTNNWRVWHTGLTSGSYFLGLNQTDAQANSSSVFNGVNSLTFTIGSDGAVNENAKEHIAYCFAEVEGFSKFGTYIGNGAADGPFVYCGGSPRFVMIKRIDAASDWYIWDVDRDLLNPLDAYLLANTTAAETGTLGIDALSNGFKLRSTIANVSGGTYIFAVFMQNPFKGSNAF